MPFHKKIFDTIFGNTSGRDAGAGNRARKKSILAEIRDDKTISDVTKNGLTKPKNILDTTFSLDSLPALLNRTEETFRKAKEAKEGTKFSTRQGVQKLFEVLIDQPGSRQTRTSQSSSNTSKRNSILGI